MAEAADRSAAGPGTHPKRKSPPTHAGGLLLLTILDE
jgi:hypothetical protein